MYPCRALPGGDPIDTYNSTSSQMYTPAFRVRCSMCPANRTIHSQHEVSLPSSKPNLATERESVSLTFVPLQTKKYFLHPNQHRDRFVVQRHAMCESHK